jgi:hypothetical protein
VRGGVARAEVRLGLDDARADPTAVLETADEHGAQQVAGRALRRLRERLPQAPEGSSGRRHDDDANVTAG